MPQCYNPSLIADQDTSAFGKGSRYMKATAFNQNSLRRVNVLNKLETKFTRMRMSVLERHTARRIQAQSKARINILESYKRTLAYRLVLKKHPIRKHPNYREALNDSYSLHSLRNEIKQMLHDINPDSISQRKAKTKVEESKEIYDDVIATNRNKILDLIPKKKPEIVVEEEDETRTPTPPPPTVPFRRSIVGPPLRGLALQAQGVTLKMVKEQSWLGTAASSGAPTNAATPIRGEINPHATLPPIPVAREIEAAA